MYNEEKRIRFLIINSYFSTKQKKELLKYFNNLVEENKNYKDVYSKLKGVKNIE